MARSLCSGPRAEKAGGACQALPGSAYSRAAGCKGSSIHLAGTAEQREEGFSDLGERSEHKGTTKGTQSSSKRHLASCGTVFSDSGTPSWPWNFGGGVSDAQSIFVSQGEEFMSLADTVGSEDL